MILTVTPNTALDLTLIYDETKLDQVLPAKITALSTAGKPVDASFVLGEMGIPTLATGFAAGLFGKKVVELLESKGGLTDFVWVNGGTRINTIVIDRFAKTTTTYTSDSLIVSQSDQQMLIEKVERMVKPGSPVITGGSLPSGIKPSFYASIIRAARQTGSPVIFDGSGDNLSAGLPERPTLIKPNQAELAAFVGNNIRNEQDALDAAREIFHRYGTSVVVTMGKAGSVAVFPDGSYRVHPILVEEVVSAAGAGDAVLAGLAVALDAGRPLVEGLILGAAAAASVLLTPGTADCKKVDILRFLPDVQVEKLSN